MTPARLRIRPLAALLFAVAACGGEDARPPSTESATPSDSTLRARELVFREDPDDRIVVFDAETEEELRSLAPGEGGFLRGALRPLRRERVRYGVPENLPYVLRLRTDGALILEDQPTGMVLDVAAFGSSSREQFMTLLDGPNRPDTADTTTLNRPLEGSR